MGRHGGGSSSGGSSRSSSSSRSGGSSSRSSSRPFSGGYNRSYYDRRGRHHSYYTTNRDFGKKSGWNIGTIFALVFVTIHMCLMLSSFVQIGGRVNGDRSRIFIEDKANILTAAQEREVISLFKQVYEESGMPVTLYTDDLSTKRNYISMEYYSENLYYQISDDEDAMLILFLVEGDYDVWEYDMYCGDDTIKCFSDEAFDKLLSNFQRALSNRNLAQALADSWNSVMGDLGKTSLPAGSLVSLLFMLGFYSIFYIAILSGVKKQNEAYRYFKNNPGELSSGTWSASESASNPVPTYGYSSNGYSSTGYSSGNVTSATKMYSKTCNFCGISNDGTEKVCSFCGAVLDADDK